MRKGGGRRGHALEYNGDETPSVACIPNNVIPLGNSMEQQPSVHNSHRTLFAGYCLTLFDDSLPPPPPPLPLLFLALHHLSPFCAWMPVPNRSHHAGHEGIVSRTRGRDARSSRLVPKPAPALCFQQGKKNTASQALTMNMLSVMRPSH